MSFKYLEPQQSYEDRYDVITIKECLQQLEMLEGMRDKMKADEDGGELKQTYSYILLWDCDKMASSSLEIQLFYCRID